MLHQKTRTDSILESRNLAKKLIRTFPPKPDLKRFLQAHGVSKRRQKKRPTKISSAHKSPSSAVGEAAKEAGKDGQEKTMRKTKKAENTVEDLIRDANPASVFDLTTCDERSSACGGQPSVIDRMKMIQRNKLKRKLFPFGQPLTHHDSPARHRIEYQVEQPIRVAIRLEYLMGNATAYLNDMGYINRLNRAIQKEEEKTHKENTAIREGREMHRVKKLVLDGRMDPPPGMESLKEHPVFKVNQMLQAMREIEQAVKDYRPRMDDKIIRVEPFQRDPSGEFFKHLHEEIDNVRSGGDDSIPTKEIDERWMEALLKKYEAEVAAAEPQSVARLEHKEVQKSEIFRRKMEKQREKTISTGQSENKSLGPDLSQSSDNEVELDRAETSVKENSFYDEESWNRVVRGGRFPGEEGEPSDIFQHDLISSTSTRISRANCNENRTTLAQLQKAYRIEENVNLCSYVPYESDIIVRYIDEATDVDTMYKNAEDVRQAYIRETVVAEDFVRTLSKFTHISA